MPYGQLSGNQSEILGLYVKRKKVHDLGAGDLTLSKELLDLGADSVVAIEKARPVHIPTTRSQLEVKYVYFHQVPEDTPIDTAFVSWPCNWPDEGLLRLVKRARTALYLGKNTEGTSCGGPALFGHLLTREVLAYVPRRQNTLIVYGRTLDAPRTSRFHEELSALDSEKMHPFKEEKSWFL